MSNLRQELKNKKAKEEKLLNEAAYAWVEDNIFLITEKLNRAAVTKLTNSIVRFDEKFGPFKEKLPEIQKIIDDAEVGLQLVLTGKTSESRATDMLRKLSMVYTMLSDFFGSDLPALLKTPIFKAAKENPTMRLDSISDPSHDPNIISATFANALRPSKDELKLMGKVYKSVPMPSLKAEVIAKQLLGMSFQDLMQISSVERIPMVAVEKPGDQGPVATDLQSASVPPSVSLEESEKESPQAETIEEDLDEQVSGNENIAQLSKALGDLTNIFSAVPELKDTPLFASVTNLRKEAQKAISGGRLGALMRQGPAALLRDPTGKVMAQAQMAVEMFRKLGAAWPKIQPLFADGNFDAEEQQELTKILKKELDGGLLAQLKNAFKVPSYQGLSSADVIKVISDIASSPGTNQQTGQKTAVAGVQESKALKEDFADLQSFFSKLNTSFKPQRSGYFDRLMNPQQNQGQGQQPRRETTPTQTTGQTQPTTPAANVGDPKTTQPTQGTGAASTRVATPQQTEPLDISDASEFELQQLEKATGIEADRLAQLGRNKFVTLKVDPRIFKNVGPG